MKYYRHEIVWHGPENTTVILNEDGVQLNCHRGLEEPDLMELVELIQRVKALRDGGAIPVPEPPTQDDIREMHTQGQLRYLAKLTAEAICPNQPQREEHPF